MEVINTPVSPYIQNAPIAYCASTLESIYVDPGDEIEKLMTVSNELNLKPQYIFITHGHIDHAGGAVELARETLGVTLATPRAIVVAPPG